MTDKVKKIREELARLKEETSIGLSEHENGVEQGRMEIINALSLFLDSMQEEPVSSIWHDASNKPTNYELRHILVVYTKYGREYVHLVYEDGCYTDAQGTFD